MVRFLACLVVFLLSGSRRGRRLPETRGSRPRSSCSGPENPTFSKFGLNAILVKSKRTGRGVVYNLRNLHVLVAGPDLRFSEPATQLLVVGRVVRGTAQGLQRVEPHHPRTGARVHRASGARARRGSGEQRASRNRLYAYDYYTDNCSTRVRDALDRALGGALKAAARSQASQTYREHSLRLTADDLPLYVGLDSASPATRIGRWASGKKHFLPEKLAELARRTRVENEAGESVPLVTAERVHFRAERSEPLATPAFPNARLLVTGALAGVPSPGSRGKRARAGATPSTPLS